MELAGKEISFYAIRQIKDKKEFRERARKLERFILSQKNALATYRLALEIDSRGLSTKRLESHIIAIADPRYLIRFARDIRGSSTLRLQESLLELNCAPGQWAMFGIAVKGADREKIEKLIIKSGDAKAAYLCLRYFKHPNIKKLKDLIIRSKRPRYLFYLTSHIKSKKDLKLIQDLIIASGNATYMRMFAKYISCADVLALEEAIIETGNVRQIQRFAIELRTSRALRLSILL